MFQKGFDDECTELFHFKDGKMRLLFLVQSILSIFSEVARSTLLQAFCRLRVLFIFPSVTET